MIKRISTGYEVTSKGTGRNLGKSKTKKGALNRLRQVEYFKNQKGSLKK